VRAEREREERDEVADRGDSDCGGKKSEVTVTDGGHSPNLRLRLAGGKTITAGVENARRRA
jgi:hypothetical protein